MSTLLYIPAKKTKVTGGLKLTFDLIANAPVVDPSDVSLWNTFFNLPTYGTAFTSVALIGNEVELIGGSGVTLRDGLFTSNSHLVSIHDENTVIAANYQALSGCSGLVSVVLNSLLTAGDMCFSQCYVLTDIKLPLVETAGSSCFEDCWQVSDFDFPKLIIAGEYCFYHGEVLTRINFPLLESIGSNGFTFRPYSELILSSLITLGATTGNDFVFSGISGLAITLTIPSALMICNAGLPDGDIQNLQANNTVTITEV